MVASAIRSSRPVDAARKPRARSCSASGVIVDDPPDRARAHRKEPSACGVTTQIAHARDRQGGRHRAAVGRASAERAGRGYARPTRRRMRPRLHRLGHGAIGRLAPYWSSSLSRREACRRGERLVTATERVEEGVRGWAGLAQAIATAQLVRVTLLARELGDVLAVLDDRAAIVAARVPSEDLAAQAIERRESRSPTRSA